ncbi:MAG TPA: MFS transporter [Terriglobia bacterium]|nr:MFS transporter [Terriglobia bacterium]
MTTPATKMAPGRLTPLQWVICVIAVIGFAFDTYEILMLPLVLPPALMELVGAAPGSPVFQMWVGRMFFVPAIAGGIFGLLGGYLTDRWGRRRVLTYSILLYAFGAFTSGFSTSIEMLLVLRCLVFIGVSVEFVAAVAWLAELFPEGKRREKVLGYTQAFSSFGGVMVATANAMLIKWAAVLPAIGVAASHAPWRYTLMSGVIPAIPLLFIRPFLPESPVWREKRAAGTLKRPSIAALFTPEFRRVTIISTIMVAMAYGAAFGAIQQLPQIIRGLDDVKSLAQQAIDTQSANAPQPLDDAVKRGIGDRAMQAQAAAVSQSQEFGGLVGRVILALLVVAIASRRRLVRLFQIPGLIAMPVVFGILGTSSLNGVYYGAFIAGLLTVGQFSFWGNYLPRMYPVHLRGTGESFAANIGGRLFGTSFAFITAQLAVTSDRAYAPTKLALVAAGVGFSVYLVGFIASFWLPEPREEGLPE